jgi:hypothetical protein
MPCTLAWQNMEFSNDLHQGGTQERLSARQLEGMLWALVEASNAAHESNLQNTSVPCSICGDWISRVPCHAC